MATSWGVKVLLNSQTAACCYHGSIVTVRGPQLCTECAKEPLWFRLVGILKVINVVYCRPDCAQCP